MENITEHHPEKEWESHSCVDSRVDFFVKWNTISINDFLEGPHKIIGFYVGRPAILVLIEFLNFYYLWRTPNESFARAHLTNFFF